MNKRTCLIISTACIVAACSGYGPHPPPLEDIIPPPLKTDDSRGTYTVTIVTGVGPDGELQTITRPLDAAEEEREEAKRAGRLTEPSDVQSFGDVGVAQQRAQDVNCSPSSVWIFDQPAGQRANKVCFFEAGVYDLRTIGWDNYRIKSIWPGSDRGQLTDNGDTFQPACYWRYRWAPFGPQFNLTTNGAATIHLGYYECNTAAVCPHKASVTGAALTFGCHSCAAYVCWYVDSFCCSSSGQWDSKCVTEASQAYNLGHCTRPDYHCIGDGCL